MLALDVNSRVKIVMLKAVSDAAQGAAPVKPSFSGVESSENSVSFKCSLPENHGADSVIIKRMGMHAATFRAEPGKACVFEFCDKSALLQPGLGYTYEAVAVSEDGRLSEAEKITAFTDSARPDLIVRDIRVKEPVGQISAGDKVVFEGSIVNAGEGSTLNPASTYVGMYNSSVALTFSVDGKVTGWGGDGGETPMRPGETRVISPSGGPSRGIWTASEGTHVVSAEVDDINRINTEKNKINNRSSRTITVGGYSGLLSMTSEPSPGVVNIDGSKFEDWVVFSGWKGNGEIVRKPGANKIGLPVGEEWKSPSTRLVRKPGANKIGLPEQTGEGFISVNPGCAIGMGWTAEGGVEARSNFYTGLWGNCVGNGFTFTVPADGEERELKVYAGVTNGGQGEFSCSLSDGSAPSFSDRTWNANLSHPWAPVPAEAAVCFTVRFRAEGEGESLEVSWKLVGEPNRFLSQIRLQAATLEKTAE